MILNKILNKKIKKFKSRRKKDKDRYKKKNWKIIRILKMMTMMKIMNTMKIRKMKMRIINKNFQILIIQLILTIKKNDFFLNYKNYY